MIIEKTQKEIYEEARQEILDGISCLRRYENMNGDDCVRVDVVIEIVNSAMPIKAE